MSREDVEAFWKWYDEVRGSLSTREVEKRAHVPRGRVGNAASEKRRPSLEVCRAIADGLPAPRDLVLKKAGYSDIEDEEDIIIRDVTEYLKRVPLHERARIREYAEWRYRESLEARSDTNEA